MDQHTQKTADQHGQRLRTLPAYVKYAPVGVRFALPNQPNFLLGAAGAGYLLGQES
jgi:hypothetical protein